MKFLIYYLKKLHQYSGLILYLNLVAMIFLSLIEGVGLLLLIPLINFSGILNINMTGDTKLSFIYSFFNTFSVEAGLLIILTIYLVLMLSQGVFQRNQQILNTKIQQGFSRHVREETYQLLLQAKWSFFIKKRRSDIINIMTTEIGRVTGGVQLFLQFVTSLVFTCIQIGLSLYLSFSMTLFVLFFGFLLVLSSRGLVKKSNDLGKNTVQLSKKFLGGMTDHFSGIKDIKSNTLEGIHIKWFKDLNHEMEENMIGLVKVRSTSQLIYKIVSAILLSIFVYFSIRFFHSQPTELMVILLIFSRLWPRLSAIQASLEQIWTLLPSFYALGDLQSECKNAKELDNEIYKKINPISVDGCISLKNVSFSYDNGKSFALSDINVEFTVNQTTAIVGPSGAGKSTLIDLLMGLNQPDNGEVHINGKKIDKGDLLPLRKAISYVPQDPYLFNGSIKDNLLLVKSDASDDEIWEALQFASADEFVKRLPNGFDTIIGDRGIRLSGGERQRIVLARAIIRKPALLVLDEATSALDTKNERIIQDSLDKLKGKMTIIIVAHRLSTIRSANQVLVLDKGRIIQAGGFQQLANDRRGLFSTLLGKQLEATP
ncbi:ABC transporter ATP-binding protein [Robertmurraya sp. FSL R5-0851]|uniref:ABC transporter ATP-binding protein n=1 Tax=Robertmurraya sp. FSL R5-0851 TaxID=2921584 RepID=UPI0030FBE1F4